MTWYLSPQGEPYTGDRQLRVGIWDQEIPERPSPDAAWNGSTWATPTPDPAWLELESALRSSDIFGKAFETTNTNAWALLLSSLHSLAPASDPGRLSDFEFAIAAIRMGLTEDFTAEQLERFNGLLTQYNFPFQVEVR